MATVSKNQKGKMPEQIRASGSVRDTGLTVRLPSGSVTDTSTLPKRRRSPRHDETVVNVGQSKRVRVEEKSPAQPSAGGPSGQKVAPSVAVNAKGKIPTGWTAQHKAKGAQKVTPTQKKARTERKVRPAQLSKTAKQIQQLTQLVTELTSAIAVLAKKTIQQQRKDVSKAGVPRRGVSVTAEICSTKPNWEWRPVQKRMDKEQIRRVQPTTTTQKDASSAKGPNARQRRTAKRTAERLALSERFARTGSVLEQVEPVAKEAAVKGPPRESVGTARQRQELPKPVPKGKGASIPFDYEKHTRQNVASQIVRHISAYDKILSMIKRNGVKTTSLSEKALKSPNIELELPDDWTQEQMVTMLIRRRTLGDRFDIHFERAYATAVAKF